MLSGRRAPAPPSRPPRRRAPALPPRLSRHRAPASPPRHSRRRVALLGIVQGPTELLPVSSSAHIALLPRLMGWREEQVDAELRNAVEAALHGGAAAALVIVLGGELARAAREQDRAALASTALALIPSALAGYLLEQRPERRAGASRMLPAGLALGGAALAWADARPATRGLSDFGPRDGLALGLAQALALLPGVSRSGAALTAGRARGFGREDAHALSWRVGLPVIAGAAGLKAVRLAQRGAPPGSLPVLAAGAGAAFLSTIASAPLTAPAMRAHALWPCALYRVGLALLAAA